MTKTDERPKKTDRHRKKPRDAHAPAGPFKCKYTEGGEFQPDLMIKSMDEMTEATLCTWPK